MFNCPIIEIEHWDRDRSMFVTRKHISTHTVWQRLSPPPHQWAHGVGMAFWALWRLGKALHWQEMNVRMVWTAGCSHDPHCWRDIFIYIYIWYYFWSYLVLICISTVYLVYFYADDHRKGLRGFTRPSQEVDSELLSWQFAPCLVLVHHETNTPPAIPDREGMKSEIYTSLLTWFFYCSDLVIILRFSLLGIWWCQTFKAMCGRKATLLFLWDTIIRPPPEKETNTDSMIIPSGGNSEAVTLIMMGLPYRKLQILLLSTVFAEKDHHHSTNIIFDENHVVVEPLPSSRGKRHALQDQLQCRTAS